MVDELDGDEFKSGIEKLLSNTHINNLIKRYNRLKNELDTNKKRLDFFNSIDNLWKSVFLEGQSLAKGKDVTNVL